VPYHVRPDNIPVHDTVVVCPEIILLRAFIPLEYDNGKTALMEILPEVCRDLVFLCRTRGGILWWADVMEPEVLGKIQREDRDGEVPAREQGGDLRVEEVRGGAGQDDFAVFAVVERSDLPLPVFHGLDLVEDKVDGAFGCNIPAVRVDGFGKRVLPARDLRLVAVDKEDVFGRHFFRGDEEPDGLVEQGGL